MKKLSTEEMRELANELILRVEGGPMTPEEQSFCYNLCDGQVLLAFQEVLRLRRELDSKISKIREFAHERFMPADNRKAGLLALVGGDSV